MMPLNRANEIRRELEEEHGSNAEQANGTMMVVDEMVDHGIDRAPKSIADFESTMINEFAGLRSETDEQFQAIHKHFKLIEWVMPVASAFFRELPACLH